MVLDNPRQGKEGKRKEGSIIPANTPEQGLLALLCMWLRSRRGFLLCKHEKLKKYPCRPSQRALEFRWCWTTALQEYSHDLAPGRSLSYVYFACVFVVKAAVEACATPASFGLQQKSSLCPKAFILSLFPPRSRFCFLSSEGFILEIQTALAPCEGDGAQVTHLSLEALQPHDVLAARGVLLPKVLPEGVDLQGELPFHLGCLQGDTSCHYPRGSFGRQLPPPAYGKTCPDTTCPQVLA